MVVCCDEVWDIVCYIGFLIYDVLLNCVEKFIIEDGIFCVVLFYDLGEEFLCFVV